ncbi:MAG: hypothetical protein FWB83_08295 [Treponema sp.]|nr:hypothetical protein [Treponema sp.]
MLSKGILVPAVFALAVTGAFAQINISAGGGEVTQYGFTGGFEFPYSGFGVFGFVDAVYAEVSAGYYFGAVDIKGTGILSGGTFITMDFTSVSLGILGKYPFSFGENMSVWPALGIEYNAVLSAESGGYTLQDASDFSHLWIRFGAGLDYAISHKMYIRGTILYGLRLSSKFESDLAGIFGDYYEVKPVLQMGHGPVIKIAVGYRF